MKRLEGASNQILIALSTIASEQVLIYISHADNSASTIRSG
jgi:hypothetical protein